MFQGVPYASAQLWAKYASPAPITQKVFSVLYIFIYIVTVIGINKRVEILEWKAGLDYSYRTYSEFIPALLYSLTLTTHKVMMHAYIMIMKSVCLV